MIIYLSLIQKLPIVKQAFKHKLSALKITPIFVSMLNVYRGHPYFYMQYAYIHLKCKKANSPQFLFNYTFQSSFTTQTNPLSPTILISFNCLHLIQITKL